MIKLRIKMATAAILAVLLAFLLVGISYLLFPNHISQQPPIPMPIPKPEPLLDQILWTIQWIGLAALASIAIVGTLLFVNRLLTKKLPKQ